MGHRNVLAEMTDGYSLTFIKLIIVAISHPAHSFNMNGISISFKFIVSVLGSLTVQISDKEPKHSRGNVDSVSSEKKIHSSAR